MAQRSKKHRRRNAQLSEGDSDASFGKSRGSAAAGQELAGALPRPLEVAVEEVKAVGKGHCGANAYHTGRAQGQRVGFTG